jgi:predicted nucleic acid-binding Zn ribbon protein
MNEIMSDEHVPIDVSDTEPIVCKETFDKDRLRKKFQFQNIHTLVYFLLLFAVVLQLYIFFKALFWQRTFSV